ncbi:hypothetical protein CA13_14010 [Planctomycetes bacterium CA13]|uniref:Uncharacterized protein n=1 Tax=Novipirellula herctigrandis TaxID=2527986 RepID=A0A5C5YY13_9BACT|nr:hypothetical protein CA13_14010 [Planctomycetes bacterium CA13]
MIETKWNRGDWVIYRKQKTSTSPGQRASNVHPATKGDLYHYTVDKFWIVDSVLDDGQIELCTRRGKKNTVDASDPMLRKANWWQRLIHRGRYQAIMSQ